MPTGIVVNIAVTSVAYRFDVAEATWLGNVLCNPDTDWRIPRVDIRNVLRILSSIQQMHTDIYQPWANRVA